jgi:Fe-S-cluster-containing hydrogenase component 2
MWCMRVCPHACLCARDDKKGGGVRLLGSGVASSCELPEQQQRDLPACLETGENQIIMFIFNFYVYWCFTCMYIYATMFVR